MIRVLTPEEELALRRTHYDRLAPGVLFDLGGKRSFIAIEKFDDTVRVIELDTANVARIIQGVPCEPSTLHFDEMVGINLRRLKAESSEIDQIQPSAPNR